MAAKLSTGQVKELAEEAAKHGREGAELLNELLLKPMTKAGKELVEELLEKPIFKPKPTGIKPRESIPAPVKKSVPAPSKPDPKLTPETKKPELPKAETQPLPKVSPNLQGTEKVKKKSKTREENKGIVKIEDVGEAVEAVLEGDDAKWQSLLEVLGLVQRSVPLKFEGGKVSVNKAVPRTDAEKIMYYVRERRLAWRNPRKREKLKVPGRYPGGVKKADIMRRLESEKIFRTKEVFALVPASSGGLRERRPEEMPFRFNLVPYAQTQTV